MSEYQRSYPLFSLCGLNCGLCPRYQSEGASRCPGCGGQGFAQQHPTCAVITCSKKHGAVEYCFQCRDYPCDRYLTPSDKDSFITYRNREKDMQKAAAGGVEAYQAELNEKTAFLEYLLRHYNDGRKKNFYCLGVNLLDLADLNEIKERLGNWAEDVPQAEKIKTLAAWFTEKAASRNIELKLRN